jgi:chromate transporter
VNEIGASAGTSAPFEVFRASLGLGLTSFGGPIAHLGYFERMYVQKLRWLSAADYAAIVALCQLLPGPSSSQVGFLIGYRRAGWGGGLAAWTGFTLPSALLMYGFALSASGLAGPFMRILVHGLLLTAVSVVAQAVWRMARSLCPDRRRKAIAILALALLIFQSSTSLQVAAMVVGALGGWLLCRGARASEFVPLAGVGPRTAWSLVAAVGGLLLGLPILAALDPHGLIAFTNIFYRTGALVFGGGHVVLPILRDALVPTGWVSDHTFLTGYGSAQALPGPLFTFAAYLGAASAPGPGSGLWAALALFAIFLPGLLLAVAGLSLWGRLGGAQSVQAAIAGINAAVVGVLGAALYRPVCTTAIHSSLDFAVAVIGLVLLERRRLSPILVAAMCIIVSPVTDGY